MRPPLRKEPRWGPATARRGVRLGGGIYGTAGAASRRVCVESERQSGPGRKRSNWPGMARYAGMGLELAGAIIALTLVGLWVDYKFGTGSKGVITGALLGIVGGLYNFIRQALALMRQEEAARKGEKTDRGDNRTDES